MNASKVRPGPWLKLCFGFGDQGKKNFEGENRPPGSAYPPLAARSKRFRTRSRNLSETTAESGFVSAETLGPLESGRSSTSRMALGPPLIVGKLKLRSRPLVSGKIPMPL